MKPLSHRHASALMAILSHPLVCKYNDIPTFNDLADFRAYLQNDLALWYQHEGGRWCIEYNKTIIGSCGVYNYNNQLKHAEIGFELHPDYWHLGFMNEALVAVLDYYRSQAAIPLVTNIIARCDSENIASLTLLEKFKFTKIDNEEITYNLKL
ncbi:GNAT family N-acetyltransferase [Pseudoalteromonas tunicata]|nr:GNAT family N-acetyltransferase [Pseudoalteromonas tunicata]MDP5212100.1 GNAT family N-acetyltransferase [Pseudoalteromonas tunicata]